MYTYVKMAKFQTDLLLCLLLIVNYPIYYCVNINIIIPSNIYSNLIIPKYNQRSDEQSHLIFQSDKKFILSRKTIVMLITPLTLSTNQPSSVFPTNLPSDTDTEFTLVPTPPTRPPTRTTSTPTTISPTSTLTTQFTTESSDTPSTTAESTAPTKEPEIPQYPSHYHGSWMVSGIIFIVLTVAAFVIMVILSATMPAPIMPPAQHFFIPRPFSFAKSV